MTYLSRAEVIQYSVIEMQEGLYAGWGHVDGNLMSLHLFGHPKSRTVKSSPSQPWWGTKDVSNSSATQSPMGNAPHLANRAEYTSAANIALLIMELALVPKLTRILAG